MDKGKMRQMTKCVHAGGYVDAEVGGVTTPIYASSAYRLSGGAESVRYPRYYNIPTQKAAADKVAALEEAGGALVVSSGMAAVTVTLLALLGTGDHAVVQNDIYGGTFSFVAGDLERWGIDFTLVQSEAPADFEAAIRENTKVIYFETPTNPQLKVVDIRAIAEMARKKGVLTVIDGTFASPINQRPLTLGVDVVIHSGTKYLGGHSDLCCGVIASNEPLMEKFMHAAVNHGVVLSPMECYRLERSLKTLGLRVRQQNENSLALAEFLAGHPKVTKVNYPGLPDDPGHEIAKAQMDGFGGMMSVELRGSEEAAHRVVDSLSLFAHAVSLGGVESLVCFPKLTSHAKMPAEERAKLGITDSLIRVSVGIEDAEDLIADFSQALEKMD